MTETLVLSNVRIWDGVRDDVDAGMDALAIAEGKVVFTGAAGDAPPGDVRDMAGATVIPGLIDAHVHLCLDPDEPDPMVHGKLPRDEQLAGMRRRAGAMVRAGITAARDLGGGQWLELVVRDEINRGETVGPHLRCSGQPITSVGGHCHFWGGEANDTSSALEVLARQSSHGVDLIKVMATGGNITPGSKPIDSQFDEETLTAIVGAANDGGYPVAAHCHGTAGIGNAARAGVTTIEHCSWVGESGWHRDYDDGIVAEMADRGTWVSPTINAGWARFRGNEKFVALLNDNYERMKAAGVRLIASTDAGIPRVYHDHLPLALPEFAFFAGLSAVEVLRSATSDCATAIGLGAVTGRLASGYDADVLVVDGDPLSDLGVLAHPVAVFARGREVERGG